MKEDISYVNYDSIGSFIEYSKEILKFENNVGRTAQDGTVRPWDNLEVNFDKNEDKTYTIRAFPTCGTVTEGGLIVVNVPYMKTMKGVPEEDVCNYMIEYFQNNKIKQDSHGNTSVDWNASASDNIEIKFRPDQLEPDNKLKYYDTLISLRENALSEEYHY